MNFRFFISLIILFLLYIGCDLSEKNSAQAPEAEFNENKLDSVLKEKMDTVITNNSDSIISFNKSNEGKNELAGIHDLTLQWISWEDRGRITFTSIGKDKYTVEGIQDGIKTKGECKVCYLKIKGVIEKITSENLKFTGKIESSVHFIDSGNPCIKEGTFSFVATGNRKYWRCQNMEGCDGVTDYIDIYF
jgi:hypothetical protein